MRLSSKYQYLSKLAAFHLCCLNMTDKCECKLWYISLFISCLSPSDTSEWTPTALQQIDPSQQNVFVLFQNQAVILKRVLNQSYRDCKKK